MMLDPRFKVYFIIESIKKISFPNLQKATGIMPAELKATIAWLERAGMIKIDGETIILNR